MYIVTPFPNVVYALDLTKPGAPVKWSFDPHPSPAAQGVACCDVVNRGGVFSHGKFYFNTLDNFTIGLDANKGTQLWRTQVCDIQKGKSMTMAPLVIKNKVIVGVSGGEFGVRGWVKHSTKTAEKSFGQPSPPARTKKFLSARALSPSTKRTRAKISALPVAA